MGSKNTQKQLFRMEDKKCGDCLYFANEVEELPYCLLKDLYTDAFADDDACDGFVQKQIEQASLQYAEGQLKGVLGRDCFSRYDKMRRVFDYTDIQQAFEDGAEWTINNKNRTTKQ